MDDSDASTLPPVAGGGLRIPRFGPDTTLSVFLPPPVYAQRKPEPGQKGKQKPPKQFKVPGGRTNAVILAAELGDRPADTFAGRTAMVQFFGRSVPTGQRVDGPAELAAELLSQGVLRESDWCGSLGASVRRGIDRWAHEEMGLDRMRVLTDLELVYTDDSPAYAVGVRLPRWVDFMKARADRPIGFFAFRWGVGPRRVRVRAAVEVLEAAWPGYGYSLLNLVETSFRSSVNGYGFQWGQSVLQSNAILLKKFERMDQDPFDVLQAIASGGTGIPRDVTEEDFFRAIPEAAVKTAWRPEQAEAVRREAQDKRPELAGLTRQAMELWQAMRAVGMRFHCINHAPFLSWHSTMTRTDRRTGKSEVEQVTTDRLQRAPACYTSWDDDDPMQRLADDFHEHCRRYFLYTDLTWMHCFQIGLSGAEPKAGAKHLEEKERLVRRLRRDSPELLSWVDPLYEKKPMPDGSLADAVTAVKMAVRTLGALDALLWSLDSWGNPGSTSWREAA